MWLQDEEDRRHQEVGAAGRARPGTAPGGVDGKPGGAGRGRTCLHVCPSPRRSVAGGRHGGRCPAAVQLRGASGHVPGNGEECSDWKQVLEVELTMSAPGLTSG